MWDRILDRVLRHLIRQGELSVTFPDGEVQRYGDAGRGPVVSIALHDPALMRKLVLSPDLGAGEGYMEGQLTIEGDDLHGFLSLAILNVTSQGYPGFLKPLAVLRRILRPVQQFNPMGRSRTNVQHHYDLSGALYDLFLDEDRQYSCAYFADPDMTLEQAQTAKKHHIAGKLVLRPGMRVLDIGCGWGGMALTLAQEYGVHVVGVTLSTEQHRLATQRAADAGLSDRIEFRLMDYRDVQGPFDRIVSVGMFEHVGAPQYRTYFNAVRALLAPDGVALIHTIGRSQPPGTTSPWITKYIFPGGYAPALSETAAAYEGAGLVATDIEVWRLHYAETLRHWYERFMENVEQARALYDERFCRMWRYYLVASELTFRLNNQVVFQMQLSRQQDAVPLTRDYLYTADTGLRDAAE